MQHEGTAHDRKNQRPGRRRQTIRKKAIFVSTIVVDGNPRKVFGCVAEHAAGLEGKTALSARSYGASLEPPTPLPSLTPASEGFSTLATLGKEGR